MARQGIISPFPPEANARSYGRFLGDAVAWSPDGHWLKCAWDRDLYGRSDETFVNGSGLIFYRCENETCREYVRMNDYAYWAGNDMLWVIIYRADYTYYYLRSLRGGPDQFLLRSRNK